MFWHTLTRKRYASLCLSNALVWWKVAEKRRHHTFSARRFFIPFCYLSKNLKQKTPSQTKHRRYAHCCYSLLMPKSHTRTGDNEKRRYHIYIKKWLKSNIKNAIKTNSSKYSHCVHTNMRVYVILVLPSFVYFSHIWHTHNANCFKQNLQWTAKTQWSTKPSRISSLILSAIRELQWYASIPNTHNKQKSLLKKSLWTPEEKKTHETSCNSRGKRIRENDWEKRSTTKCNVEIKPKASDCLTHFRTYVGKRALGW